MLNGYESQLLLFTYIRSTVAETSIHLWRGLQWVLMATRLLLRQRTQPLKYIYIYIYIYIYVCVCVCVCVCRVWICVYPLFFFECLGVSKLMQPINMMIYYWDKCNGGHLEHILKKNVAFDLQTSNQCFFNCYNISFQDMQSFLSFLSHLFCDSLGWFCPQTDNDTKYFPSLGKGILPKVHSCHSVLFSNLKQNKNTIIIRRVINSHRGSMYIETPYTSIFWVSVCECYCAHAFVCALASLYSFPKCIDQSLFIKTEVDGETNG